MAWLQSDSLGRSGRHPEAIAVASATLDRPDLPLVWAARLRALLAMHACWGGSAAAQAEAQVLTQQAETDGIHAGDRFAIAHALHARSRLLPATRIGRHRSLALISRALRVLGEHPETINLRLLLLANQAIDLEGLDRAAEADHSLRQALVLAERYGIARRLAFARLKVADSDFLQGRWDDATAELDAADAPHRNRMYEVWRLGLSALIAVHREELDELARYLSVASEVSPDDPEQFFYARYLLTARALATERDGRPELALTQLLGAVLDRPDAQEITSVGDLRLWLWLPDVVRLAIGVGQLDTAARAVAAAQTQAASARSRSTRAVVAHCQALLAGDPEAVLAAADGYAELDLALFAAQAWENAAVLYAEHADMTTTRTVYARAVQVYTNLGAVWDVRRGDGRLRRLGIRRGRRGSRRPGSGWQALTAVELQVADLVATGRSNPDIARELFLSAHTVRAHVSHILAKLQAQSRVDIAREAVRHQPTTHNQPRTRGL
jgi:DNA-binding CsgD family transcriptional regulator